MYMTSDFILKFDTPDNNDDLAHDIGAYNINPPPQAAAPPQMSSQNFIDNIFEKFLDI